MYICILLALIFALPAALLYMYVLVDNFTSGDMTITGFVPLVFKIPILNIIVVLVMILAVLMAGVLTGYPREKNITALIRSMAHAQEAENHKCDLPEEGNLSEYGRLYVRRSVKRSIKYNLIAMFLLVLPVIFLFGMTSVKMDRSKYTFSLVSNHGYLASDDNIITENMIAEADRIPGIVHADGVKFKRGDMAGFAKIRVYTEENADLSVLKNRLLLISEKYSSFTSVMFSMTTNTYL